LYFLFWAIDDTEIRMMVNNNSVFFMSYGLNKIEYQGKCMKRESGIKLILAES